MKSKEIRLASRPKGKPTASNFAMSESEIPSLQEGQVLVRNLFMSVDPYMRGRMNDVKSYVPPFEIGKALTGGAIGEVIDSKDTSLKPGAVVTSMLGWREYAVASARELQQVNADFSPLSIYLGTLGMTGLTAWVGLRLVELKAGETVFVSGAAGAVGSVAGQLAKIKGCRVIGSAGSEQKIKFLTDKCGFDAAFNYKTSSVADGLKRTAPDGIDVYFDNVGGDTLEAALAAMRIHGRIVACGSISGYNEESPKPGPSNLHNVITKRLTIKGLIVSDWLSLRGEFEREVGAYYKAGELKHEETVIKGIDHAVEAFLGLFHGENMGKMIVQLS